MTNLDISTELHNAIPRQVRLIVNNSLDANEAYNAQHNREILDEIIADLQQYASTLPSLQDLELCQVL